jgi:Cytochrome c
VKARLLPIAAALLVAAAGGSGPARGQSHAGHGAAPAAPGAPATPGTRITMDALHAAGGVPPGWRFTLPPGDPAAGRQAYVDLKCYACHQIKGEQFPLKPGEAAVAGPDLTGMGRHHPTEYLVESLVNPSAVLIDGPGYVGGDGRSIMPATPAMTLAQLIDLVAYLKSQGGDAGHAQDQPREQTAGGYRVRLAFLPAADGHGDHAQHQHGGGAPASTGQPLGKGRLVAFIADAASGQAIPYAPVTARIEAAGRPARTVKLAPAFGAEGFHYAAELTLPAGTRKVTVSVGPAALKVGAGAPAQLTRAQTIVFDWK